MAALTEDRQDNYHGDIKNQFRAPVAAAAVIYRGALVSFDADGFLVPNADTAAQANKAIHLALESSDNTAGLDGDDTVLVMSHGMACFPVGTLVQADVGKTVHATDDATLALTSTNGRIVGPLDRIEAGQAIVRLG